MHAITWHNIWVGSNWLPDSTKAAPGIWISNGWHDKRPNVRLLHKRVWLQCSRGAFYELNLLYFWKMQQLEKNDFGWFFLSMVAVESRTQCQYLWNSAGLLQSYSNQVRIHISSWIGGWLSLASMFPNSYRKSKCMEKLWIDLFLDP